MTEEQIKNLFEAQMEVNRELNKMLSSMIISYKNQEMRIRELEAKIDKSSIILPPTP